MTATTPTPDSGAAASRDAARTARRLTAEPRGPRPSLRPPEPAEEGGSDRPDGTQAVQRPADQTGAADANAVAVASEAGPATGQAPTGANALAPGGSEARAGAPSGAPGACGASEPLPAPDAPGAKAPEGTTARPEAPMPPTGADAGPRTPGSPGETAATAPGATSGSATDPRPPGAAAHPAGTPTGADAGPRTPSALGAASAPVSVTDAAARPSGAPAGPHAGPRTPGSPGGTAATAPGVTSGSATGPRTPEAHGATASRVAGAVETGPGTPGGAPRPAAGKGPGPLPASPESDPRTPGATGPVAASDAARSRTPQASAATAPSAHGGSATAPRTPQASAAPAPTAANGEPGPSRAAEAATPKGPEAGSRAAGGRPKHAPDLHRIVRGEVGVVAVPVVAEAPVLARPVGRRKNVIGAETTGSIPVHLLFRDQPDADADSRADDDGGPATVAMPAPVAPAPPKAVIPAPTRPEPSRPAPTADPKLVERDGAVLPGWTGVVAGALALTGCAAMVWWVGAVPDPFTRMLRLPPRPYNGIHLGQWALLTLGVLLTLFSLGGLGRGRVGYAWVLTLFGDYRGSVRRTGLVWMSPLLLRRRVDIRLRHWRSEPLSAVDAKGTALNVVVLVVWRIRDTVRAALGVDGHEDYLREQVEAAMARVLSQLPADAFHEDAPTLRDAEAVGEALTRMLSAECAPVGIDVFSAQPTRIEYAPELAAAMQRRRIAAIDAKHRDSVLTSVVDAVDDVVHRLTTRGLVELDDYERKALVKDLTVAFYTGRTGPVEGA